MRSTIVAADGHHTDERLSGRPAVRCLCSTPKIWPCLSSHCTCHVACPSSRATSWRACRVGDEGDMGDSADHCPRATPRSDGFPASLLDDSLSAELSWAQIDQHRPTRVGRPSCGLGAAWQSPVLTSGSRKRVLDQGVRVGSPNGVRTRVSTLRGWCPGPLDDGTEACHLRRRDERIKFRYGSRLSGLLGEEVRGLLAHLAVQPLQLERVGHADRLEPVKRLQDQPRHCERVAGHQ